MDDLTERVKATAGKSTSIAKRIGKLAMLSSGAAALAALLVYREPAGFVDVRAYIVAGIGAAVLSAGCLYLLVCSLVSDRTCAPEGARRRLAWRALLAVMLLLAALPLIWLVSPGFARLIDRLL
jgi:hypothetical protein